MHPGNRDRSTERILAALAAAVCLVVSSRLARAQDEAPAPLAPRAAAGAMTLPAGFQATLFAGEPHVVQPIAMALDDRGRLWVVECLSYPDWSRDGGGKDRVVIFEDVDGDGRFDQRTVFWDQGSNLSGLELGFGGVWLCSTPNLVFLSDADADDKPDGPPQVVLDGWDLEARHNVFNGLCWGPDGWLYGLNGILSNSLIGAPGTPAEERTAINCGVWRYHPTRRAFEVVAHGTTNPWGIDFDDVGEMFITNCVISHLWHVVPGARFERMFGQDFNEHTYQLMTSCADHLHWAGGPWYSSRGGQGEHSKTGGGHAHSGAMIYLGDNWPDSYRGNVFTVNIHGSRVNQDVLEASGSGYVAHHGEDFLFANDSWFRGLALQYGPDGGVYLCDWSDSGECHDYEDVHRESGRIFKITHGRPRQAKIDLAAMTDLELARLALHKNDWHVRHARRILQQRAAGGTIDVRAVSELEGILDSHPDVTRRLRALWALHVTGNLPDSRLAALLDDPADRVRGWAVRLQLERPSLDDAQIKRLAAMAGRESSPVVRLSLASGIGRRPPGERWDLVTALANRGEDAADANIPALLWYASEPLVGLDIERAVQLAGTTHLGLLRQNIARRITNLAVADGGDAADLRPLDAVSGLLARLDAAEARRDVLSGMRLALAGRRNVGIPPSWQEASSRLADSDDPGVRESALLISLILGDPAAFVRLQEIVADPRAEIPARERALEALVQQHDAQVPSILLGLIQGGPLRAAALRAMAAYDDPRLVRAVIDGYGGFDASEREDALLALASRPAYALALLDSVESGAIDREHLSAFAVRQIASMNDSLVTKRLEEVWGLARPTSQDKAEAIAAYKELLTADALANADLASGRLLFNRHCAVCHRLYDQGHKVGPDLTGSQRSSIDYLLENLVDPNALVGRDYTMTIIETQDGRVINGMITAEANGVMTIQTQNEQILLRVDEVADRQTSSISLMPEGQLKQLTDAQIRDLIAYLSLSTAP